MAHRSHQHRRGEGPHRGVRQQGGQAQPGGEMAAPVGGVTARDIGVPPSSILGIAPARCGQQTVTQQPRRLHRHAHALANDGVGFSRCIANPENAVVPTQSDAGMDRTGAQPRSAALGGLECGVHTSAFAAQHRFDHLTRRVPRQAGAQCREPIGADAARNGGGLAVGHDHATVASLESEDGEQAHRQIGVVKVGFESEQVAATSNPPLVLSGRRQGLPGTVGQNHHTRLQLGFFAGGDVQCQGAHLAGRSVHRQNRPRLEHPRASRAGLVEQQGVERFAAQRPSPGVPWMGGGWQRRACGVMALHERHALQGWRGERIEHGR